MSRKGNFPVGTIFFVASCSRIGFVLSIREDTRKVYWLTDSSSLSPFDPWCSFWTLSDLRAWATWTGDPPVTK